ncbi:MAG: transposase [Parafilimonas sp.]
MALRDTDLFIFDRYYASHLLMFYLNQRNTQFCFRMKKNWWKVVEDFYNSGSQSRVVEIALPQKDRDKAMELGIKQTTLQVRLVRVELESGETEILLTSLTDGQQYSVAGMKQLYGLRWPVEESYKAFKHKVCVENFSGKSPQALLQDFYVKIFIMNLTAVAVKPINKALEKQAVKVKHTHQVNFTEAIFMMRNAVVSFFISQNIKQNLLKIWRRLMKVTEPVRPGRKFKRPKLPKRKFHMNYKQT